MKVLIAGGGTGDGNNAGPPRGGIDHRWHAGLTEVIANLVKQMGVEVRQMFPKKLCVSTCPCSSNAPR